MGKPIHEYKTAADAYEGKFKDVQRLMTQVQTHLGQHLAQFVQGGKTDWGYAGDLAMIEGLLKQALGEEE